ncbi:MAG: class E sortase [Acidimicrobiales bacterium]|nr:class E sortase [Acidimicrobiales bacterium]
MRVARALSRIGKVLITAGVLILSFVAYQLWGTGLQTAQAQDDAESQFEAAAAQYEQTGELAGGDEGAATTTTTGAAGATTSTTAATTATTAAGGGGNGGGGGEKVIPAPPEAGGLVGRIQIPAIGADWYFYEGTDLSILKDGPGHYLGTPLPGQPGNAAIAGHRTTYGAPFNRVDELASGDEIVVTYVTGAEFTYSYRSTEIVTPDRTDVLQAKDFDEDGELDNMLTLTACHPKYSARERIIIRARLDEAPVPVPDDQVGPTRQEPISLDDAEQTEPVSKTPAVLWGLAAAAIWLTAYLVGRAWRKWPAYVLGFPFFVVTLYVFFENFYKLLPAGF